MSETLKNITGALSKYEKYLNNSTGRAWRGAVSKDMGDAVSVILVGKKTPQLQTEPKIRITLRDEDETQKVRISYEDPASRTSKVKEVSVPTANITDPGFILRWVMPYLSESVNAISDNTKKLIASMIPGYETFLKKATKKTWRGVLQSHGQDVLFVKMLGRKGPNDIVSPQILTRIKYDSGKDLFDLKESFLDGQAVEHKVKEVDGIGLETLADPMAFFSWVPAFLEMHIKGKRLKKTSDTKALFKAATKVAAHESSPLNLKQLIEALEIETGIGPESVEEAFGTFSKKIKKVKRAIKKIRRGVKKAVRGYKKANRSFIKGQKVVKKKYKAIKKSYKAFKKKRKTAAKSKKLALKTGARTKRAAGTFQKQSDGSWAKT